MKFARFGIGSTLAGGDDMIAGYSRVGALTILVCGKLLGRQRNGKNVEFGRETSATVSWGGSAMVDEGKGMFEGNGHVLALVVA